MKSLILFAATAVILTSLYSCQKCSTCVTTSDDPQTEGEIINQEVCGRGRDYKDQIDVYTRTNWTCTEK